MNPANATTHATPPNRSTGHASAPGAPPLTRAQGHMGESVPHESAVAQVQGSARYVDDLPEVAGLLHAAPVLSPVAHGTLHGLDTSAALAEPGVVAVLSAADIPGDPILGAFTHDEPVLAMDTVQHVGQVMALVVATDVNTARRAARLVRADIRPLPPVLHARQAHAQGLYVLPSVHVARGDADAALARAPHVLSGQFEVGGQEHFYLEGQIAYALPQEQDQWLIHSSTQHPGEIQHWVAHALGLSQAQVRVECRRMGGGFGGKETQSGHLAVWAALAAQHTGRPVKMRLDRDDDFLITGKRHPVSHDYTVGFDDRGRLCGLKLTQLLHCGFSADLSGPVADRAIFHSDNAYFLQDVAIASHRCKTHTQSHTAYRGFGGPQGVIAIETILGDIARHLGLDPLAVRLANLYDDEPLTDPLPTVAAHAAHNPTPERRDTTHYGMRVEDNILLPLMAQLANDCSYEKRKSDIARWNAQSPVIQRGLALTPVKFGISFTATLFNQAGALVHVYTDGSVLVNHGGTEMGQGLHTKVAQIVATELGVALAQVQVSASDTARVPNASATAASSGTDLNGRAAQLAARQVRERLAHWLAHLDGCDPAAVHFACNHAGVAEVTTPATTRRFAEVARLAHAHRVQLWSDGFYRTPKIHYDKNTLTGRPFYYFAYGAACTEVAIDTLTGENRVLAVDILHDVGHSLNPAIDIGQIEGGFVQGMGWLTTEELVWQPADHPRQPGALATRAPSTYKVPAAGDVPAHFRVNLWPEANREDNVGGSKAVGEPPFMLAISVWEALRDAVAQARLHRGLGTGPVRLDAPATAERVLWALRA